MVQSVEGLPAKLEVFAFRDVELLGQGAIHIPETGSPEISKSGAHCWQLPVSRISDRGGARVHAEGRLECGGIDPLVDLVGATAVAMEVRIANQVAPGGIEGAAKGAVG